MAERKTTKSAPSATAPKRGLKTSSVDQTQIEQRAYERYLQRGGSDGHDVEDWLQAEQELRRP